MTRRLGAGRLPAPAADDGATTDDGDVDADAAPGPGSPLVVMAITAAIAILADQLTKWWAVEELQTRTVDIVWSLRLNLVFNRGAAFSLGDGFGPIIAFLALGVVGVLVWQGRTLTSRWGAVALGLVLGGALGNLLDRFFRDADGFLGGRVVDFIDVQWWPVFNVADMAVVIGAFLLLLTSMREPAP